MYISHIKIEHRFLHEIIDLDAVYFDLCEITI